MRSPDLTYVIPTCLRPGIAWLSGGPEPFSSAAAH